MTSKTLAVSEWIQEDMKGNVEEKKKKSEKGYLALPQLPKRRLAFN